jgi:F-type H+-transporting ATPase subunit b
VLVDPFTIVAQAVNFLVLAVVLKYVLYDRVVAVIDRRRARIDDRLARAEERETAAAAVQRRHEQERRAFEREREQLLADAREEADRRGRELLAEARDEVDELRAKWLAGMHRERERILSELERRAAREAVALGEQALADLADAHLEDEVVRVALRRLQEHRDELVAELVASDGVTVHTAFPLHGERRGEVVARLRELLGRDLEVAVERTPELLCGLEVRAGDHAFGWNVGAWLADLRRRVEALLDEELRVDAHTTTSARTSGTPTGTS